MFYKCFKIDAKMCQYREAEMTNPPLISPITERQQGFWSICRGSRLENNGAFKKKGKKNFGLHLPDSPPPPHH